MSLGGRSLERLKTVPRITYVNLRSVRAVRLYLKVHVVL
jgi:hypothetical protein